MRVHLLGSLQKEQLEKHNHKSKKKSMVVKKLCCYFSAEAQTGDKFRFRYQHLTAEYKVHKLQLDQNRPEPSLEVLELETKETFFFFFQHNQDLATPPGNEARRAPTTQDSVVEHKSYNLMETLVFLCVV